MRSTAGGAVAIVLAALLQVPGALAQDGVETQQILVGTTQRMIVHRTTIAAPPAAVWQAISTADGWRTWAVPVAYLDELRPGAMLETSYRADARRGDPANIHNTVVAYLPEKMLAFAATNAPPNFPDRELLRDLASVIELEPVGAGATRVTASMMGYGTDPKYDRLFEFFTNGNALTLRQLRERFATGPVDWAARAAARPAPAQSR
jgi:uncharacterized protein YndB with AHSA1/START domain